jgi:type I restriction enzyme R subunit
MLAHFHDKLVLDWRRKADASADVLVTIKRSLDEDLPDDTYPPAVFDAKVQLGYDHVFGDDGTSDDSEPASVAGMSPAIREGPLDIDRTSDAVLARIRDDPEFATRVAVELDSAQHRL